MPQKHSANANADVHVPPSDMDIIYDKISEGRERAERMDLPVTNGGDRRTARIQFDQNPRYPETLSNEVPFRYNLFAHMQDVAERNKQIRQAETETAPADNLFTPDELFEPFQPGREYDLDRDDLNKSEHTRSLTHLSSGVSGQLKGSVSDSDRAFIHASDKAVLRHFDPDSWFDADSLAQEARSASPHVHAQYRGRLAEENLQHIIKGHKQRREAALAEKQHALNRRVLSEWEQDKMDGVTKTTDGVTEKIRAFFDHDVAKAIIDKLETENMGDTLDKINSFEGLKHQFVQDTTEAVAQNLIARLAAQNPQEFAELKKNSCFEY